MFIFLASYIVSAHENHSIVWQHLLGRSYVFFNGIWLQKLWAEKEENELRSIGGRAVYPLSSAFYQGCVRRRRWRALVSTCSAYDSCLLIVSHLYLFIITCIIYLCSCSFFWIHCGSSVKTVVWSNSDENERACDWKRGKKIRKNRLKGCSNFSEHSCVGFEYSTANSWRLTLRKTNNMLLRSQTN